MRAFGKGCGCSYGTVICLLVAVTTPAFAQSSATPSQTGRDDASIEAKISELSTSLDETRAELAESREEIKQLRTLLEKVSQKLEPAGVAEETAAASGSSTSSAQIPDAANQGAARMRADQGSNSAVITQDDWDVLNSRMDEERQIKVASGSKFPLRLSGMFLANTLITSGSVDDFDVPTIALPSRSSDNGSTGFSLRQSIIGLEGTGPRLLHAATSADVQADFFGGAPTGYEASSSGLMRLRLARMRMDWTNTSIIGGLDTPFFSPDSPSSYLTVAAPAFSAAGNLWTWSTGVRVEQRFDTKLSQLKAEAGVVDVPSYITPASGTRLPSPGEDSRSPAIALRLSANGRDTDRPVSIGLSGIYLTQRFYAGKTYAGGGGMADWKFHFLPRAEFSGELFAGKGLDGFGALPVPVVTPQNYTQYITLSAPALAQINTYGGWSQVKLVVNSRGEFNFAAGAAAHYSATFRQAALTDSVLQTLGFKNESLMINYIYRPRSDLVFSAEYRRFRTYQISGTTAGAGQTGLTAGFIF